MWTNFFTFAVPIIKFIDDIKRVGLIELNMPDSRNKIHSKKMPITTWLFDEMEVAGSFNKGADERLFMWTKAYRKPFDEIKKEANEGILSFNRARTEIILSSTASFSYFTR